MLGSAILLTVLCYPVLIPMTRGTFQREMSLGLPSKEALGQYAHILKRGFPLYLATLLFTGVIFADRFALELGGANTLLGKYMLALQIALADSLILGTQNVVNVIDIGEQSGNFSSQLQDMFQAKVRSGRPF